MRKEYSFDVSELIRSISSDPILKKVMEDEIKKYEEYTNIDEIISDIDYSVSSLLPFSKSDIYDSVIDVESLLDIFYDSISNELKFINDTKKIYSLKNISSRALIEEILDVDLLTDGKPAQVQDYFSILKEVSLEAYQNKIELLNIKFSMLCMKLDYYPTSNKGINDKL